MENDNNELVEKLITTYRNSWLETISQLVVVKAQLEIVNDRLMKSDNKVKDLQKQIEALKQKPVQQAQKQEQK